MVKVLLVLSIVICGLSAQHFYQYPQQYYYQQQQQQQYYPQQYYQQQQQQQFQQQPQFYQQLPPQPPPVQQPERSIAIDQIPKKDIIEGELAFDLPPPPPSQFAATKSVQPISRTRLVQRPPQVTHHRRVVSASHRAQPFRAGTVTAPRTAPQHFSRVAAPVPARRVSVPAPPRPAPAVAAPRPARPVAPPPAAPVSHLSPNKKDPNTFFLSCCKNKKVAKSCESRCNFEVLTKKVLTGMFLGSDPCPQAHGLDLFSCAAQDEDHTPCCRRNKVQNTSAGDKCLAFCKMTPDSNFQADASYLPCWAVLNKIKTCFRDGILHGIEQ